MNRVLKIDKRGHVTTATGRQSMTFRDLFTWNIQLRYENVQMICTVDDKRIR